MEKQFDDRYPAIFQPGGNELPRASGPARRDDPAPLPGEPDPQQGDPLPEPADIPADAATPWPVWLWLVPLGTAVAMLAAGFFALTAQYWLEASMVASPANSLGVGPEPWGQRVNQAAPALLSVGFGLLAALLFLATRIRAQTEAAGRTVFGVLTLLVGVAGWIALYAFVLFPEQANFASAAYDGSPRRTPWTYVVMSCGPQLLVLALFMLAVLVVVPRLWQDNPTEGEQPGPLQATGKPSVRRGAWFGAITVAAGLLALFAAVLFPPVETARSWAMESAQSYLPAWSELVQFVTPPLMLGGLGVLAWAAIRGTLDHVRHSVGSGAVQRDPTAVEN